MNKESLSLKPTDIEIKNLCKSYGEKTVFNGYDLSISAGSVTALMGLSGAGKTTLLRLIAGLEKPDSGSITGVPDTVSMVFQEDRLCEQLTALENVSLVLPRADKDTRSRQKETILRHFEQTGLDISKNIDSPVSSLSGGMKRRVALVRAMLYPSVLVLLDEPCKGLDETTRELTINYIKKERRGRTMLIVTHDEAEALSYGQNLIRL